MKKVLMIDGGAIVMADYELPSKGVEKEASKPKRKTLMDYRVPPRSMTPEEKEYYDKHKTLDGFYK